MIFISKKVILYDVIISNGYKDLYLGKIIKEFLPGFRSLLYDLCYSNPSSDLFIYKKDLDIICDFLLNTFSISLSQDEICFLKSICKTPFFIKLFKIKRVLSDEIQE